jgi:hypothetical protein
MLATAQVKKGTEDDLVSLFGLLDSLVGLRPCNTKLYSEALLLREVDETNAITLLLRIP